jgi:hypothetical protein
VWLGFNVASLVIGFCSLRSLGQGGVAWFNFASLVIGFFLLRLLFVSSASLVMGFLLKNEK